MQAHAAKIGSFDPPPAGAMDDGAIGRLIQSILHLVLSQSLNYPGEPLQVIDFVSPACSSRADFARGGSSMLAQQGAQLWFGRGIALLGDVPLVRRDARRVWWLRRYIHI